MRLNSDHLDHARRVADAILYEGYLLYPYHKAAQKNQIRFQFGVLMPPGYAAVDPHERSASQTECLLECGDDAEVRVLVRFLHLRHRTVQGVSPEDGELHEVGTLYVDGIEHTSWDEAAEREQRITATVSSLLAGDREVEFHIGSGRPPRSSSTRAAASRAAWSGGGTRWTGSCGCTPSGWPARSRPSSCASRSRTARPRWPGCRAAPMACGTR